ncbi:MAG: hypothetical protein ABEJ35_02615 [Halobacteriaceae archaeon]
MGKVSVALKGWRFDEAELFDDRGEFRPLSEMDPDTRLRLNRLTTLRDKPCDACWLIHGEDDRDRCRPAAYVYGEPRAEVLVCERHLPDFSYWYLEDGGDEYRGEPAFQEAFHEWFAAGNRAPAGYEGIEHEETDPEAVPEPVEDGSEAAIREVPIPEDEQTRLDLRRPDESDAPVEEAEAAEAVDEDLADALEDL